MSATLLRAHIPGNNSTMNAISRCNSIQFNWIFFKKKLKSFLFERGYFGKYQDSNKVDETEFWKKLFPTR